MIPPVRSSEVAGLILAAGASSRMPGRSKLLQPWKGGVLLEAVVSAAVEAGLDPLVVVLGSGADALLPRLSAHPMIPVCHEEWSRGRASSLAAGLGRLAGIQAGQAVVVLLGDEPGVSAHAISAVVETWRSGLADLVRVRYSDRPGHPVLLGPKARELARELDGEESVWDRLTVNGLVGREVTVDSPAPIDVDSPSALDAARAREDAGQVGPDESAGSV